MKTRPLLLFSLLASLAARAETVPGFTVHEWGTFTTFAGSDGQPVPWFLSYRDVAPLPEFVHKADSFGKVLDVDVVRMETPVLYFYPPRPMPVEVRARLISGRITEWFPGGTPTGLRGAYGWITNQSVAVAGELLPPSDSQAAATVPSAAGPSGAHYAAARAVPEAWFFRSRPNNGDMPETDRLFFYRGAGKLPPPYNVFAPGSNEFGLLHSRPGPGIGAAYALSVRGSQARWGRLPALSAWEDSTPGGLGPQARLILNSPARPLDEAERDLSTALTADLAAAGLTGDEARAMIATWRGLWFREEGDRVLALLPRAWIDQALPLVLTPAPDRLERVFVARLEVLVPERMAALQNLLDALAAKVPKDESRQALSDLALGRFTWGALDLGLTQQATRIRERFGRLVRPREHQAAR